MDGEAGDLLERHTVGPAVVLTVRPAEVYGADTIQRLAQEIRNAFRTAEVSTFVLDLANVRFLTSGALGMFIHLRSQLADQHRLFVLAGAEGEVARTLACTRLAEVMPVYESVEAAVRGACHRPDAAAEDADEPS
ncbi:MAG: STAS domain-containing protein [Phycisphaerae bacterium]